METKTKLSVTMPQWAVSYFKTLRVDLFYLAAGVDGIVKCQAWKAKERNPDVYSARWHADGIEPFSGFAFGQSQLDLAKATGRIELVEPSDAPQQTRLTAEIYSRKEHEHNRHEMLVADAELLGILVDALEFSDSEESNSRYAISGVAIVPAKSRSDAFFIASTDGRRMSVRSIGVDCRTTVDKPDTVFTVLLPGKWLVSAIQSIGKRNWKNVARVTVSVDRMRAEPHNELSILMADGELRRFIAPPQVGRFPGWSSIWEEAINSLQAGQFVDWPSDSEVANARHAAELIKAHNKIEIESVKRYNWKRGKAERKTAETKPDTVKVYLNGNPFDFKLIEPFRSGVMADSRLRVVSENGSHKLIAESKHAPRITVAMGLKEGA